MPYGVHVHSVAISEFPFVEELPKREKSKVAGLWDAFQDARAATKQHGCPVPINFAAELLGISRQRVHILLDEGRLQVMMIHKQRFVSENSLVAWAKTERLRGRPVSLKRCAELVASK